MNQHEFHVAVSRVAQHVLQIQRIAVRQAEVIANAHGAVKMDGEFQLSRLIDQHAKNVILERSVVFFRRHAASAKLRIDGFCFFARRIAEVQRAKIGGFKFHGHAASFLVVG